MKHTILTFFLATILLSLVSKLQAQDFTPDSWTEDPQLTELSNEEAEIALYYLLKKEIYQYAYDDSGSLICFKTYHHKIRVNNDEAIQQSNKIYISLRNTIDLVNLKARTINPGNKVVNFDEKNIKELKDDNSGYKILAIEGAEVGGEIEYFYTVQTTASHFMTRVIQASHPIKKFDFSLSCPDNLSFDFKIYNASIKVMQTDTTETSNDYALLLNDIPALNEEDFSAYENSKIRLELKLAYNAKSGDKRINSWADAGKVVYNQVYEIENSDKKAVTKFLKGIPKSGDPLNQFKQIEHFVKTNYNFEEQVSQESNQITNILKNQYASSLGFTKLYAEILNQLSIKHEIVLTSNRLEKAFDPEFDSWNYLDDYLIYITEEDLFLSPKSVMFRLGMVPDIYVGSYGLFIRQELIQDFMYPITHVGVIPIPNYEANYDNMKLEVTFSDDLTANEVNLTRDYKGYSASYYKAAWLFLEEKRRIEMIEDAVKYLATDAEIQSIKASRLNNTYDKWDEPFEIQSSFKTQLYIETAGDVILFKVGDLIGPQSEMYQDTERMTTVVNSSNRGYDRRINVQIPDGYSIKNPEDLIIIEKVKEGEKDFYVFESEYRIKGQILEIKIIEYYDQLIYPTEKFEAFRTVINSAADWNKIVLVLTPE